MDLYRILNVSRTATSLEIKQAYRKLAMKYHPDMNPTRRQEAEEHFKKITHAYQTLLEHTMKAEAAGTGAAHGMPKGYGDSSQRHAYWNPQPSYKTNSQNQAGKERKYDEQAAYNAYKANQHHARTEPYINPDHFNVNAWRAGHYGDDTAKIRDNIKYRNSWAASAGKHQQYYARKNEAKQQQAQEEYVTKKQEQMKNAYDAGSNLRKKREERMNNNQTTSTPNGDVTKCVIS